GEVFVERPRKTVYAPTYFAIVAAWTTIVRVVIPKVIDGNLLKLPHLSISFRMLLGMHPFKKDDVVEIKAQISPILERASGKIVEVCEAISRDGPSTAESVGSY
ncbi:hypothetical protein B9Z19DRAFT_942053, partial [Tuber borchii]